MSCMKKPENIGPLLGYCNHRVYQRMEQKLRRYGVTPIQCRSLTYLHRQPGPVTQKQLQQHLAVKPSTVNGIVDRLVEKGMLTRSPGQHPLFHASGRFSGRRSVNGGSSLSASNSRERQSLYRER